MTIKKSVRLAVLLAVIVLLGAKIHQSSHFRPAKNFHVVDEGKFYRSAQLTADELSDAVQRYGIRSVINLRGAQPGEWWFDDEDKTLKELGVQLENIGFSTEYLPNPESLQRLLAAYDHLPRPILVHCRAGADRTGEASALYAIEHMGQSKEKALEQLSVRYLHVELFQPSKRHFVERYQGRDWAAKVYDPCAPDFIKYASAGDCAKPAPVTPVQAQN